MAVYDDSGQEKTTVDVNASEVDFTPSGDLVATNVQTALVELDTEKAAVAEPIAATHISDTSDAHDASAISVVPSGGLAATDAQAALVELDTDKAAVTHTDHPNGLDAFGAEVDRMQYSKMVVYGHSLAYGGGASEPDRDVTTHLASMLKIREIPRAKGGAVLGWAQVGGNGDGGWVHVLQNELRKQNTGTTLAAQANAGATTLTLTAASGFVNGQAVNVGTGDTGASGGEVRFIVSGGGTTTLTLDRTLDRTHANGQPVYQVTTGNINLNPLYLCWYGLNDLGANPITASDAMNRARYWDVLRLVVSRFRCSEVFENDHVSCVYTGTWVAATAGNAANSGDSRRRFSNADNVITIHVPDNFPGGAIDLGFMVSSDIGTPPVLAFTVDGVSAGSLTLQDAFTAQAQGSVKRITGLAAGRHQIVVSVTTLGTGTYCFDWWGIEAVQPPVVLLPGLNRPYSYVLWASNTNARRTTQLNGTEASGQTVITVDTTANMMPGATVTFEEGTGNAETGEVLTVDSGTQFTLVSALTLTHLDNSAVVYGMQDADVARYNALLTSFCAEFSDGRVIAVDIDTTLNKDIKYFFAPGTDGAHFTDLGHAVLTNLFYEALMDAPAALPILTSYTATPTAPLPSNLTILTAGVTATNTTWATMPAALTEIFGATLGPTYRQRADLRRCFEWRFIVQVRTAGFAGSALRLRYSIDNGATFRYLGRSALYAEDGTVGQCLLTATGEKDSGWQPFPADALVDNAIFQTSGILGNGVVSPIFGNIYVMIR